MPPALSDDEKSEPGDVTVPVPTGSSTKPKKAGDQDDDMKDDAADNIEDGDADGAEEEEDDEEEEDEDGEDDVYVVEKILDHMIEDGTVKYKVKWEGFEKKKDQTWEPEDGLQESASEILDEYLAKIGGREKIFEDTKTATKTKKRGRPASNSVTNGTKRSKRDHPAKSTPPASATARSWKPPAGSWEEEVDWIDACHDEASGKLVVYLTWKNGHKTQHDTRIVYQRCPQKMLLFYERHVRIIGKDS